MCALSYIVQYLSIFITVTYCTKYSVLLLAVFVNVLMCIIFKLNCILGMYEY